MSFIDLNLLVCPNALLSQTQAKYHLQIFSEFFSLTSTEHLGLLSILQQLAGTAHPFTRGWLGYFSLKDCDFIERLGPLVPPRNCCQFAIGQNHRCYGPLLERCPTIRVRLYGPSNKASDSGQ